MVPIAPYALPGRDALKPVVLASRSACRLRAAGEPARPATGALPAALSLPVYVGAAPTAALERLPLAPDVLVSNPALGCPIVGSPVAKTLAACEIPRGPRSRQLARRAARNKSELSSSSCRCRIRSRSSSTVLSEAFIASSTCASSAAACCFALLAASACASLREASKKSLSSSSSFCLASSLRAAAAASSAAEASKAAKIARSSSIRSLSSCLRASSAAITLDS
mmetsp:Transcript_86692/g.163418  ORF Transcript_86692/g.163418 Transcript_86692/m.163418 type:complete len:225 (-) Transcript_86692:497-1171(-)